jgi:hypothetical protein
MVSPCACCRRGLGCLPPRRSSRQFPAGASRPGRTRALEIRRGRPTAAGLPTATRRTTTRGTASGSSGQNGTGRHRVSPEPRAFAWSPDGKRLAVGSGRNDVSIVGVDGRRRDRLRLDLGVGDVRWSPDGRQLLLSGQRGDDATQIWVVRPDGDGLRRVTSAGWNGLVGWTPMAAVRRALAPPPSGERVVDARTVETRARVGGLSADGSHVAFVVKSTRFDCEHVAV